MIWLERSAVSITFGLGHSIYSQLLMGIEFRVFLGVRGFQA